MGEGNLIYVCLNIFISKEGRNIIITVLVSAAGNMGEAGI